jgi:KaiC/GvpD/RAD55 family RecA-like ATPase
MTNTVNDQLVLISGESGSGKSASLMNLPNHEKVMYLNCEAGKKLPFKNKFKNFTIVDPMQVLEAFDHAHNNPDIDVIVIDTLTFLMEMYESLYVLTATNTMQAWSSYAQFFKTLMQDKVANSDKSVIFLAHTRSELDEKAMEMKTSVPVKGSLKNNGVEAYFSTVIATKKISLKDLEPYGSDLLTISEQDKMLGYKHVFQTQLTKATIGERIRAPMGMFNIKQTYINNDAGMLLNHLKEYYA